MIPKSLCILLPNWLTSVPGGAELQCYLIGQWFFKKGWSVEIIFEANKSEKRKYRTSPYYNNKDSYHFISPYKLQIVGFFRVLFSLLKTNSIYYYNRTDARLMRSVCIFYCKIFKKKSIYAIASDEELTINTYAQKQIRRRGLLHFLIKKTDAFIIDKFTQYYHFKVDKIICQTKHQQKQIQSTFNVKSIMIRNSMDLSVPDIIEKENIILWIGNMRAVKRPEIFIKLCHELKLSDWRFIMIGDNSRYIDVINKMNLPQLEILGQLNYEDTLEFFKKSKILINTSQKEGFSNTFIQAWMYEVVVISMGVDPDDLLANGMGHYCSNDYQILKNTVNEVVQNYSSYTNKLINAKEYALHEFDLESNMKKLESVLVQLN